MSCLTTTARVIHDKGILSVSPILRGSVKSSVVERGNLQVSCADHGTLTVGSYVEKRLNVGIICSTSIGGKSQVLWASDGLLFTVDGKYLIVEYA